MLNKILPMTGVEPRTSGIKSNRSTNWATTTAQRTLIVRGERITERLCSSLKRLAFCEGLFRFGQNIEPTCVKSFIILKYGKILDK